MSAQPIDRVSYSKFAAHSVWEFVPETPEHDETWVRPVARIPVNSLDGRFVASRVRLANGTTELALLGNIKLDKPELNEHFLTLSIVRQNEERFHLARYHDIGFKSAGPEALAKFFELAVSDVFPIEYDISAVVTGVKAAVRGIIRQEPGTRLSRAEIISLAVR